MPEQSSRYTVSLTLELHMILVSVFVFNDTSPYSHLGYVVLKHRSPPTEQKHILFRRVLVILTPYCFLFIVNIYTAPDFTVLY